MGTVVDVLANSAQYFIAAAGAANIGFTVANAVIATPVALSVSLPIAGGLGLICATIGGYSAYRDIKKRKISAAAEAKQAKDSHETIAELREKLATLSTAMEHHHKSTSKSKHGSRHSPEATKSEVTVVIQDARRGRSASPSARTHREEIELKERRPRSASPMPRRSEKPDNSFFDPENSSAESHLSFMRPHYLQPVPSVSQDSIPLVSREFRSRSLSPVAGESGHTKLPLILERSGSEGSPEFTHTLKATRSFHSITARPETKSIPDAPERSNKREGSRERSLSPYSITGSRHRSPSPAPGIREPHDPNDHRKNLSDQSPHSRSTSPAPAIDHHSESLSTAPIDENTRDKYQKIPRNVTQSKDKATAKTAASSSYRRTHTRRSTAFFRSPQDELHYQATLTPETINPTHSARRRSLSREP